MNKREAKRLACKYVAEEVRREIRRIRNHRAPVDDFPESMNRIRAAGDTLNQDKMCVALETIATEMDDRGRGAKTIP